MEKIIQLKNGSKLRESDKRVLLEYSNSNVEPTTKPTFQNSHLITKILDHSRLHNKY